MILAKHGQEFISFFTEFTQECGQKYQFWSVPNGGPIPNRHCSTDVGQDSWTLLAKIRQCPTPAAITVIVFTAACAAPVAPAVLRGFDMPLVAQIRLAEQELEHHAFPSEAR